MRVGRTGGPAGTQGIGSSAPARTSATKEPAAPRAVTDTASVMGIPENELTAKVRAAIMTLMEEVDRLRRELGETQRRMSQLERLADEDSLVPISNRRAFVRELSRIISFAERYRTPSSIVFFDINNMKAINDRFGHAAGDAVLLHVANLLTAQVRESDVVARLGGDEFGVILVQADASVAAEKGSSLAAAIEAKPVVFEGQEIPVGVAYGAHTFIPGEKATDALANADKAMYQHKSQKKTAG